MLDITNLTKTYGAVKALDGVDLKVNPGEMVALIGASGSGKSTILRHISGLTVSDKTNSQVTVRGQVIQSEGRLSRDIRRLRTGIGVIFQQFNLVGRLNVITNVLLGALGRTPLWRALSRTFYASDRRLALEALAKVGLESTAFQRASTLSGGQQQRVAIARALVQKSDLILADEPIASLDPESSVKVMEILERLHQSEGLTVIVSLHQIDYAVKYCPRAIALCGGRVYYDGPSSELSIEKIRSIYGEKAASLFSDRPINQAAQSDNNDPFIGPIDRPGAISRPKAKPTIGATSVLNA
ncbi:MAG: phosphonate ABC transporter ATP-binding protein [Deltaproteobacteria bacterium]|jgi:phosphonate transport system ATP-binding protein|nr:phosphonate ABC transporter ATP-binding protein [Deltaproteobacteria bacterium]